MSDDAGVRAAPGQVATRRAYHGRVISVDVDTVRYPNGSTGELEMVRHPGASAVVPFLTDFDGDDPQLLLVKQYRYAAQAHLYELPAGRLERNEAPSSCAARELKEEIGCVAEQLGHVYTFFTTPGFTDERIHLFVATGLTRGATAHDHDEFIDVATLRLSEALRMIEVGEIQDAKTALGLLYVAGFLAKR